MKKNIIQSIRFNINFIIFGNDNVGMPKELEYKDFLRCYVVVENKYFLCEIVYLGYDNFMQKGKWYNGTAKVAIGYDVLKRYGGQLTDIFAYRQKYDLDNCGKIGECIFINAITE